MLRLSYLEPGKYKIICIKDYWEAISCFAIYRYDGNNLDYSHTYEYQDVTFDDDIERSSISTSPERFGDHNCSHHRVRSNGRKVFTTSGGDGYTRSRYDSSYRTMRDMIYSRLSNKYILDHVPREWKTVSYQGTTYYTLTRGEDWCQYHSLFIRANGTVREITSRSTFTWVSGKVQRFSEQIITDSGTTTRSTNTKLISVSGSYGANLYIDINISGYPDYSAYILNWKYMLDHVSDNFAEPHKADEFGAALDAAMDFNAYDINLIEALAGFGLDDLFPKRLSSDLYREVRSFVESPSIITAFTKMAYLSSTTYLYCKYVVGNNIADLEQLLGLSGSSRFADASVIAEKLASRLSDDEQASWDFRLAKMAQKIVYKWDYLQDSYGSKISTTSNGIDTVTRRNTAHLQATPGPLRDMSTSAIILDDIGLSLRASRIAQAVRLEFIANWFIPIEDSLDRIEFNSAHLNQLYRVRKLCLSDKVVHKLDSSMLKALYGLSDLDVCELTVTDYYRHTDDKFPPTSFQFSPQGAPSLSRILQGSALLITSLH